MGPGSRLLFEDEHCLAIVKLAGQFTQGCWAPPGERTLEQEVREYLDPADPSSVYVGIVHRLDRPVSGVLIWAKTSKSARRLSQQFERRRVEKEYWAIVEETEKVRAGQGGDESLKRSPAEDTWTDWLTPPGVSGVVQSVAAGSARARQAVTRFGQEHAPCLPTGCQWLRLWPETGRTHQLRVQAALRGLPIVGDTVYGATQPFPRGIALHARRLGLRHPMLQTPLELIAPLPAAWAEHGFILPGTEIMTGRPKNEGAGLSDTPIG
jgi:23S rRNA pseudouridine1911/1915/1917 synthase